ncbi:MAG: hypothetical protein MUO41_11610, partial [Methyloceanibacter sp.]|nr:hypothetical protein [Methyloceanibacter sp.]
LFLALLSLAAVTQPEIFKAALPGARSILQSGPLIFCALVTNLAIALGLLIAIGDSLGHDLYFKTLDGMATQSRQLAVLRVMLVIVAGAAALLVFAGAEISELATGSFSLAAAAFFPALVLGIWWRRTNQAGAIAGMVAGVAFALCYLFAPYYFPVQFYEAMSGLSGASQDQWPHYLALKQAASLAEGYAKRAAVDVWINEARAFARLGGVDRNFGAVFAIPLGFVVTIVVSLLTPPPRPDVQNFVRELRKR